MLRREYEALRDETGARWPETVDAASEPGGYITRRAACVCVGRHGA